MSFESIANRYPSERAATTKLEEILARPLRAGEEYTLNSLCDLVTPQDRDTFAMLLGDLARAGFLKLVVRVLSPGTQGGIGEYATLDEVPEVVHDWRTDSELHVSPENLRVIYKAA